MLLTMLYVCVVCVDCWWWQVANERCCSGDVVSHQTWPSAIQSIRGFTQLLTYLVTWTVSHSVSE